MPDHADPTVCLENLIHVFEEGAGQAGGLTLDQELCTAFVGGLRECLDGLNALATLAQEAGLLERIALPMAPARTPTERRLLAAMAAPLDPDGRVVAFPVGPAPALISGGSAA